MSYCRIWKFTFDSQEAYNDFLVSPEVKESKQFHAHGLLYGKYVIDVHFKKRFWKSSIKEMVGDNGVAYEPTEPRPGVYDGKPSGNYLTQQYQG